MHWHKGVLTDGSDSIATEIVPVSHWSEMRILVLVTSDSRKKHSSTSGMRTSVLTSQLLKYRAEVVVPQRIDAIKEAIVTRDFEKFAEITMQDSNTFHAVCMDTYPPCVYMNDTSHAVVEMVHAFNEASGRNKVLGHFQFFM